MNLAALLAQRQTERTALVARREALSTEGTTLLNGVATEARTTLTPEESERHQSILSERATAAERITALDTEIRNLETEISDEARAAAASQERHQEERLQGTPGLRVGNEPRTYQRESDPRGQMFLRDVALANVFGNVSAQQRLARHMEEEIVVREQAGAPLVERASGQTVTRAVGTGAFTGLVVPQYLTDLFAMPARAGRPFADAARKHVLPETGMTVNLGKGTTGTTADDQANEGSSVDETDFDDTLLTIDIRTGAGSQSVSRQAVERGVGIDDTLAEDLIRAYHTNIDSKMLNAATHGLAAVATSITYTDTNPTAVELYPKLLQGPAAVEAALLDADPGDAIAVMHSRRWYWLQSQLTSTWPLFGQPGATAQTAGVNYGERYGSGFRGILPSGTPVIVDNNIVTNLGAATNQDEIYFVAQSEAHLWEDPNAPMLIRAEQTQSKNLLIDLVVYGYYAFTHNRRAHAQKITGSGLVVPAWA